MKRLLVSSFLLCAAACAAHAQGSFSGTTSTAAPATNAAASFSTTSAARVPLIKPFPQSGPVFIADAANLTPAEAAGPTTVTTALALPMAAEPSNPAPNASPAPKYLYSDRDDYRWELGIGVSFERFTSHIYNATGVGTNTDLAYFLSDSFGIEGNASTFFAPTIWNGEHIKLVNYGAGPKFTWRQPRWVPWMHALFGGTHALPQTAGHSQNGLSIQAGGGVDYRFAPRLSARAEADYVSTHLFGQWQNNFQAAFGLVLHF